MKRQNKIHIVIPYYSGSEFIHACIESIQKSTSEHTIWIVDNDPTGVQLKTAVRDIVVIRTRPGIGYGRAANIGITKAMEAGGQFFLLTNQDVIFEDGALDALFSDLESEALEVHIPLIKNYDSDELNSYFRSTVIPHGIQHNDDIDRTSIPIEYAYGACLAFNSRLVDVVGLFDPVFHMYGEDDDLLKRLRQSGGSTRLQPNASIRHYHNDEVAKGSSKYRIIKQKLRSLGILTARYDECSVNTLMSTTAKQMKYCLKSGEPALAFGLARASIHGYATGRNLKSDLEDRINAALTEDLIGHNLIDQ